MSEADTPASLSAILHGSSVRCTSSSTSDSSLARVSLMFRCFGPLASAVMYGRLISVCWLLDSSILAFSAASSGAAGQRIVLQIDALVLLNSATRKSMMRMSKSSPPRKVSPLVDSTSNWCSPSTSAISMIDTSKVPPPRS